MEEKYPICQLSRLRMGTDGEGIRTLILLAGCSLRCKYCINPQTWNNTVQPMHFTAEEVWNKVKIDIPYMLSTNGGITFGGGEPLLYPHLITELKSQSSSDISFMVETSLNISLDNLKEVESNVNRFYIDIKSMDEQVYRNYTGGSLLNVIDNIKYLLSVRDSKDIIVRIPMIPGITDSKCQMIYREKLTELGVKQFNLFEYHI